MQILIHRGVKKKQIQTCPVCVIYTGNGHCYLYNVMDQQWTFTSIYFVDCFLDLKFLLQQGQCNSYTMGCPPVRGLSYVQADKHGITILYHLHQCRPYTAQAIAC